MITRLTQDKQTLTEVVIKFSFSTGAIMPDYGFYFSTKISKQQMHKEYNRTRSRKPNRMLYCPSARQDLRRGREIMHGVVQQIRAYSVNQTYN